MSKFISPWQGPHFPVVLPKTWPKTFDPKPVFKNKSTGSKACLDMSDFLSPWSGPHFPVVCPMFVRTDLPPQPFLKNRTPAPELGWTCQHLLAHGRDLTFLSCAQDLAENMCPHTRFQKKKTGSKACLDMSDFLRPLSGLHLPVVCPRFVRTDLPPQPFLKKTNTST